MITSILGWLRVQSFITRLLGPQFHRSQSKVEIDITWDCNLRCYNCNRSCGQAPTKERMTLAQIKKFINESIVFNKRWEVIRIIGGEPTLHPNFLDIIAILKDWRSVYATETIIEVWTNGFGPLVCNVLAKIPDDIIIIDSGKNSNETPFDTFNIAPVDIKAYRWADYRNGCIFIEECGIGFTPLGWYPCPNMGGIDRIFGFGIGRNTLPEVNDSMEDQLMTLCRYCGHFERRKKNKVNKQVMSETWELAYDNYRKNNH